MTFDSENFLHNCLLFDIEVNEEGIVYSLGASLGKERFQSAPGKAVTNKVLEEFDQFGATASYLLGHNILKHDIPILQGLYPELSIFKKPAIDTLYLSPLAFPANPYHRLVKDYQIVRDSINDPVQDAILAGKIFCEQSSAFIEQLKSGSNAPILYRSFLSRDEKLKGTSGALACMGIPILTGDDLHKSFALFTKDQCCSSAVNNLIYDLNDGSFKS